MKPTLNAADISLLKKNFATKTDLKNFATKSDLKNFATREEINTRFDKLENVLVKTFQNIEDRLQALESEVGIGNTN